MGAAPHGVAAAAPPPPPPLPADRAPAAPAAPTQPLRRPLAPRMDLLNSPAPRLAGGHGSKLTADGLLLGPASSPAGALPPVHGTVAPGMYTYFDIHRGELVTARLAVDAGPGVLMEPPAADTMLVHVPQEDESIACADDDMPPDVPPGQAEAMGLTADTSAFNDTDPDALLPPLPAAAVLVAPAPATVPQRHRRVPDTRGARGNCGHAALALVRNGATAATAVGLALLGFKHRDAAAECASACATHACHAWQAAATAGRSLVAVAMAGGEAHPRMTEWQRTSLRSDKQGVAGSKGGRRREVRWQPHVSMGRG